jgi:hypothetical protein
MSDPLTEPLEGGQMPYHLRDHAQRDLAVEDRHLRLILDLEYRQRHAPTIAEVKARDQVPKPPV